MQEYDVYIIQMNISPLYSAGQALMTAGQAFEIYRCDSTIGGPTFADLQDIMRDWTSLERAFREKVRGKFLYVFDRRKIFPGDDRYFVPCIHGDDLKYNPIPWMAWVCLETPLSTQSYRLIW